MRHLIILLLLGLLASCTWPYKSGEILPEGRTFAGLERFAGAPLDVISVHGMCTHNRDWVVEIGEQMSGHLGLSYAPPQQAWERVGELEVWKNELRGSDGNIAITNYAIVWSKLTAGRKKSLCQDSGTPTKSCATHGSRRQAKVNNLIKSRLMNDCLSDAIIYAGSDGQAIREAVRSGLELISADRAQSVHPAAIISESLGSKIIVDAVSPDPDALSPDAADHAAAARKALSGTRVIYMAANQIPLLNLGEGASADGFGTMDILDQLRRAIVGPDNLTEMTALQAVAFTDPNDLLSYELDVERNMDVNVRITIAPVIFGQLANPWEAHTGYLDNEWVWRYITCGSDSECTGSSPGGG